MKMSEMLRMISIGWIALSLLAFSGSAVAEGPPGGFDVNVTNTPLEVTEVDRPVREVVFAATFLGFADGDSFSGKEVLYSVPEGKRLVIEYFSAVVNTDQGDNKHFSVNLELGPGLNSISFGTPEFAIPTAIGTKRHLIGEQVKLYSDVGAVIEVRALRGPDVNWGDSLGVKIWGYLEDAPE